MCSAVLNFSVSSEMAYVTCNIELCCVCNFTGNTFRSGVRQELQIKNVPSVVAAVHLSFAALGRPV